MKNKIKKIIITLVIIILLFQIFLKLEFLLFKIKVCNNTYTEMQITLDGNKRKLFDKYSLVGEISFDRFFEKIFKNYERPFRKNIIGFYLKPNTCSDFKNTDLFSSNFYIKSSIYKNNIKIIDCEGIGIDLPESVYNLDYGKHIININNYTIKKVEKNGIKYKFCILNYGISK